MVKAIASGNGDLVGIEIDPRGRRPRRGRAAAGHGARGGHRGLSPGRRAAAGAHGRDHGRARRARAAGLLERALPGGRRAGDAARPPARRGPAHGAAARVPPAARAARGGARAGRGDPRRQGARRLLHGVLQPHARSRCCTFCPDAAARPLPDLRRRGALGHRPARAHGRVPGPLPRARRRALADRRSRSRAPARRRVARPRRARAATSCARSCWRRTRR